MNTCKFTFDSHITPGLHLTPHFSSCVFVSARAHFVVSEQWSITVSNDFLWKCDCYFNSREPGWLRFVCLSVCMSALKFPLCMQRKKTFPQRQKSDRQGCQSRSSLSAGSTQLQLAQESTLGCLTAGCKGYFLVPLNCSCSESSCFLPLPLPPPPQGLLHKLLWSIWGGITSASTSMTMIFSVTE